MNSPLASFAIAPFRFDITPPLGHALLGGWIPPVAGYDDSLEGIGYVLLGGGAPVVVCALDWAGLMNEAHVQWRTALAAAANTTPERVAVQCVHQHNTPMVCLGARAAAARHPDLPEVVDLRFFETCLERAQNAVRDALLHPQRVTHVAHSESPVQAVASNRRVARDASGQVRAMRLSACTDPALIALPEGTIDPLLQTMAFFDGERKVVACHYYATHPMSYYRDGRVSSDFCGLARKRRQQEEPSCTHLYFTGCAGNIAAGKYNDGSPEQRVALTARIHAAMQASDALLRPEPLREVSWVVEYMLPRVRDTLQPAALETAVADRSAALVDRMLAAFRLAWCQRVERGVPLVLTCLRLNRCSILHLPGEVFVEYQLRARALRPADPVAVAATGDGGPWYLPTREEYDKGGYEVSVAFCSEDVDELLTNAIRRLLA